MSFWAKETRKHHSDVVNAGTKRMEQKISDNKNLIFLCQLESSACALPYNSFRNLLVASYLCFDASGLKTRYS